MKADDLYKKVTDDIIERMETARTEGTRWSLPWRKLANGGAPRRFTGQPYQGINWFMLTVEQMDKGYQSSQWGTYKQWFNSGVVTVDDDGKKTSTIHVREGQKGTPVFFMKTVPPSKKMLAIDPDAKPYFLPKVYWVFNRDQIEGVEPIVIEPLAEHERWEQADTYFRTIGATVTEDGDRAYYAPVQDRIAVPKLGQFTNPDHFYTTMAHEHVHWTGHESRLNRDLHNRFGDEAYAAEELVAELGAAYWGAQMQMEAAIRDDHAAYLASWIRVLKNDPKAIATAASKASQAIEHLNKLAGYSVSNDEVTDDESVDATMERAVA